MRFGVSNMSYEFTETDRVLIYLISCALHGVTAKKEKLAAADLEALYVRAREHSLASLVSMALEWAHGLDGQPEGTAKRWKNAKEKAIRKAILMDADRARVLQALEKAGIWYMPLKGVVMKEYYPVYGMRQMADNDILVDSAFQEQVRTIMESLGFHAVDYGKDNHDVYEKPPVSSFEMHMTLFSRLNSPEWQKLYEDIHDRSVKDEDNRFGYHLTHEDFYVYHTVHAYRHYSGSGTGLRSLTDSFVFLRKLEKELDWEYIRRETDRMGVSEYERVSRSLCKKLFADPTCPAQPLTEEEQKMAAFILGCGTYGSADSIVSNQISKLTEGKKTRFPRLRYVLNRIFPSKEWFFTYHPICRKHPWTIPFVNVVRLVKAPFVHAFKLKSEWDALSRYEEKDS